jgi:thiol:disulfide interchange protein DsbC
MKNTIIKSSIISLLISTSSFADTDVKFDKITGLGFKIDYSSPINIDNFTDLHILKIGKDWVIGSPNSSVVFKGDLIDLKAKEEITSKFKSGFNKPLLSEFPEDLKISYSPEGLPVTTINVLTDTSCPFCKKLHNEVPALNVAGIKVNYIPFVRGGTRGPGFNAMMNVWCSEDRAKEMDATFKNEVLSEGACLTQALAKGMVLADQLGASGTPAIYFEDGSALEGYAPAKEIIKRALKTLP